MRKMIFLFSFLVLSAITYAQEKVFNVQELPQYGLSMQHLDSIYKNGLPVSDTIHPIFTQNYFDTVVEKLRLDLLQKLGGYFLENNLKWEPSVKCWNRMYFNTDGNIDYFVYHFITPITSTKEAEFKRLLNSFLTDYRITVITSQKFSVCGGVVWTD